jgi:hypothetical protein
MLAIWLISLSDRNTLYAYPVLKLSHIMGSRERVFLDNLFLIFLLGKEVDSNLGPPKHK